MLKIKKNIAKLLLTTLIAIPVLYLGNLNAQDISIRSGVAKSVGKKSCTITVYTRGNCPRCDVAKATPINQSNGCPTINYANYDGNARGCQMLPIIVVNGEVFCDKSPNGDMNSAAKACDCEPEESPIPSESNPEVDPPVDNPPNPSSKCPDHSPIDCSASKDGSRCCIYGCSGNNCLSCSGFSKCSNSSCDKDETCVNEKDNRGCPKDFTCKPNEKPPLDEPKVCDSGEEACGEECCPDSAVCVIDPFTGKSSCSIEPPIDDPDVCEGDSCGVIDNPEEVEPTIGTPKCEDNQHSCINGSDPKDYACCNYDENCSVNEDGTQGCKSIEEPEDTEDPVVTEPSESPKDPNKECRCYNGDCYIKECVKRDNSKDNNSFCLKWDLIGPPFIECTK